MKELITIEQQASGQKWFGIGFAIFNLVVALVFVRPLGIPAWFFVAWSVFVTGFVAVYYLAPGVQAVIFRGWKRLTGLMSILVLTVVFFVVLVPIGMVARLLGHDPLNLKSESAESYWTKRGPESGVDRYFKPY